MSINMNTPNDINKIILIGGGGHCNSCIDVIELEGKYFIQGIIEPFDITDKLSLGYEVIGVDKDLPELSNVYKNALVTIGQIKSAEKRIHLYKSLKRFNFSLPIIISPNAYVSKHSYVGEGTVIMHGSTINPNAKIGVNCIINSQSLIEHDVTIEDHCHIATGAKVNGNVLIKEGSFVGSGSIIREGVVIGKNSVIGAGQIILKSIPDNSTIREKNEL